MTVHRWTEVDRYIDEVLGTSDAVLDAALKACVGARLPPINVSPSQGKFLFILAKAIRARRILELGTLGGYSTIWLARALPSDGRLVTIEVDPAHAAVARGNFVLAHLAHLIDLRVGSALDVLPQLARQPENHFDMIFIDANKENYPEYLEWSITLGHAGTLIIADNVVREGAVVDSHAEDSRVQGVRRFNSALAADSRVSATAIQTVGSKGYDGFAAVIITEEP